MLDSHELLELVEDLKEQCLEVVRALEEGHGSLVGVHLHGEERQVEDGLEEVFQQLLEEVFGLEVEGQGEDVQ